MFFGVGLGEIIWLAVAVVIGGVVTGILAGLFGIGGGAVIVPVLYEVFGLLNVPEEVRMQLCVGTSIAIIVPTAIRSYLTHREKGLVIPRVIRLWRGNSCFRTACRLQDRLRADRRVHRHKISVRGRSLEPRH
jgi:uncharacterized protein